MLKILLSSLIVLSTLLCSAQNMMRGRIIDSDENAVFDAEIRELGTNNVARSGSDGSFQLNYFSDENYILFTHIDYDSLQLKPLAGEKRVIFMNLKIDRNPYNLGEYAGYTDFRVKNPNKRLENMPYFFGEGDLNRQLQMLPGVEHGTEVLSNLYIRGGDVDQNLMSYNGTPVYNYNHLFGLTNIFHHRSIKNAGLYKGIAPASKGGRASAVVDVQTEKYGSFSGLDGEIEITPLNAGIFLEQAKRGKSYFTFAARRSWIDVLLIPQETKQNDLNFNYNDVQLNFGFKVNDGDDLEFSFMSTKDLYMSAFPYDADSTNLNPGRFRLQYSWRNLLGAVKYKHSVNNRLTASHGLHYSYFGFQTQLSDEIFLNRGGGNPYSENTYSSGIQDYIAKSNWKYNVNNRNNLDFGVQANVRLFGLGKERIISENFSGSPDEDYFIGTTTPQQSIEGVIYGEEHIYLSSKFRVDLGMRGIVYNYDSFTTVAAEPRLHGHYQIDSVSVIKFGFNRHNQFVRQLNTGGSGDPTNLWVPATEMVRPIIADVVEATYERKLGKIYSLTASAYFKQMQNLTQVNNFNQAIDPETDWQTQVFMGEGTAYGLEIMAQKNDGILTGWASYTLGRSTRQFPDLFEDPYLFQFDRTHLGKVYFNVETEDWNFGVNFLIGSGSLFTVPIGKYYDINDQLQLEYNTLNNFRHKMYHRLDLSVVRRKNFVSYEQQWKFYLYNITAARNPIFVNADFEDNSFTNLNVTSQYLAFIPGISYTIIF